MRTYCCDHCGYRLSLIVGEPCPNCDEPVAVEDEPDTANGVTLFEAWVVETYWPCGAHNEAVGVCPTDGPLKDRLLELGAGTHDSIDCFIIGDQFVVLTANRRLSYAGLYCYEMSDARREPSTIFVQGDETLSVYAEGWNDMPEDELALVLYNAMEV